MTRQDKVAVVAELKEKFENNNAFYLADSSELTVEVVNNLRRKFFEKGVEMRVVKNTLVRKALESADGNFEDLYEVLSGPSTLLFSETANLPAKVMKEFREKNDKPILKAAFIDAAVYIGDEQLASLASLKSKEELVGDVIALLQSPAKNVISALQSSGNTLAALIETLSKKDAA